jgi:hypothetical protein
MMVKDDAGAGPRARWVNEVKKRIVDVDTQGMWESCRYHGVTERCCLGRVGEAWYGLARC